MDAVAAIAEVLAWVGLPAAAAFGTVALALRLTRGAWMSAPAVLANGQFRWMAADGGFHSAPAAGHNGAAADDDFTVFYRSRRPEVCYLERVAHDERTLGIVALSLGLAGLLGFLVSTVVALL